MKESLRQARVFNEALKKKAVKDIETGKVSVSVVCREHTVVLNLR